MKDLRAATPCRWLVCAGPAQYLEAAAKLVGAGFVQGIDWEPMARGMLDRLKEGLERGVIVGEGCCDMEPCAAAKAADEAGAAITILCASPERRQGDAGRCLAASPEHLLAMLVGLNAAGSQARVAAQAGPRQPASSSAGSPSAAARTSFALRATGSIPRVTKAIDSTVSPKPWPAEPPRDEVPPYDDADVPQSEPDDAGWREERAVARADSGRPCPQASGEAASSHHALEGRGARIALASERHAPTLCLSSARGGVGKSAIATLMAVNLARAGMRVALLDLDYQFGTCLGYLGAEETDGLGDAVHGDGLIEERLLERCCVRPEENLSAYEFCRLPERGELLVPITGNIIRSARLACDVAIVDLPAGMSEGTAQAFDACDRCLLVADQRALSLESLGSLIALAMRAGTPLTKLVSVLNRCDARHRDENFLSRASFEVQTTQKLQVIDGGDEVTRMLSMGCAAELVSMRNRMALAVGDLATSICGDLGLAPSRASIAPLAGMGKRQASKAPRRSLHRKAKGGAVPCLS